MKGGYQRWKRQRDHTETCDFPSELQRKHLPGVQRHLGSRLGLAFSHVMVMNACNPRVGDQGLHSWSCHEQRKGTETIRWRDSQWQSSGQCCKKRDHPWMLSGRVGPGAATTWRWAYLREAVLPKDSWSQRLSSKFSLSTSACGGRFIFKIQWWSSHSCG